MLEKKEKAALSEIQLLITLTNTLANLEWSKAIKDIKRIRWDMGQNQIYWNSTERAYKKLILLEKDLPNEPQESTIEKNVKTYPPKQDIRDQ